MQAAPTRKSIRLPFDSSWSQRAKELSRSATVHIGGRKNKDKLSSRSTPYNKRAQNPAGDKYFIPD